MCGSRKQMYGNSFKQNQEPVVVTAETPATPYAPKEIPKIQWEPNRLYPEFFGALGLNPWC